MAQMWLDHELLPNGERQISGHPTADIQLTADDTRKITVCAECGSVRSILLLTGDRWYCTRCRNSGAGGSTLVPVSRPGRRAS